MMRNPSAEELSRIEQRLRPDYQDELLNRGRAASLGRRNGSRPDREKGDLAGPRDALLDYGYGMLSAAADLRRIGDDRSVDAFLAAAEAIESALRYSDGDEEAGFNKVLAAVAYHLGRMNARAFVIVSKSLDGLGPSERLLVALLLRRFSNARLIVRQGLASRTSTRSGNEADMEVGLLESHALSNNFFLAVANLLSYFSTGDSELLNRGRERLHIGAETALEWGHASTYVLYDLTQLLFDDFERHSFHTVLPLNPTDPQFNDLRAEYIDILASVDPAQVDLWPSQIAAAGRALDPNEDLVVALPTSAGKTRIAELAMLPALASGRDILYVTPLRALSAQIERGLDDIFGSLGFDVSSLYDSAYRGDELRRYRITVATPEKLDFSIRRDEAVLENVAVIVLDEAHLIGTSNRELRYELLIERLRKSKKARHIRIVALSAIFGENTKGLYQFASWIHGSDDQPVIVDWRPTRRRFGTITWHADHLSLDIDLESDVVSIPRFLEMRSLPLKKRERVEKLFPGGDTEAILAAAFQLADRGESVMIYNPLKQSVKVEARTVVSLVKQGHVKPPVFDPNRFFMLDEIARLNEWLGADHDVTKCLRLGVAIHHGDLPREILTIVERMISSRAARIILASPSISQGINVSASTIIFRGVQRWNSAADKNKVISLDEFVNVIGRAGRAFVDIEGQVLLYVGRNNASNVMAEWNELLTAVARDRLGSGLFKLVYDLIIRVGGVDAESLQFLTDRANIAMNLDGRELRNEGDYDLEIDELEDAIVNLLAESDPSPDEAAVLIDQALNGSLFQRTLKDQVSAIQTAAVDVIRGRAKTVIERYTPRQRRVAYLSGIRTRTSPAFEELVEELGEEILMIERRIPTRGIDDDIIQRLARICVQVLQSAPFQHDRRAADVADRNSTTQAWLRGTALGAIAGDKDNVMAFIDEALRYRAVWALDAIRSAIDDVDAPEIPLSLLIANGVSNRIALALMRAKMGSRELAMLLSMEAPAYVAGHDVKEWLRADGPDLLARLSAPHREILEPFIQELAKPVILGGEVSAIVISDLSGVPVEQGSIGFAFPTESATKVEITDSSLRVIGWGSVPAGIAVRASGERGIVDGNYLRLWKPGLST